METSKLNNLHAHFFLLLWSVDLHIKNLALILPKILLSGAIQIEFQILVINIPSSNTDGYKYT